MDEDEESGKTEDNCRRNLVYSVFVSQKIAGNFHVVRRFSVTPHFDQKSKASDWP
jgi:hypothetical protein